MNSGEHFAIGGITTFLAVCMLQRQEGGIVDLKKATILSLVGGSIALLPDALEPATNPNHRSFFHSISFGLGLIWLNSSLKENENLSAETKTLFSLMSLAYGSHLLADSTTPMELPII